jgi:hypothetical protein
VPAESSRLGRRLGARDRLFLAAFACAVVVAVPVGILVSHEGSGGSGRCITEQSVGFMGAQWLHLCGTKADAECKRAAAASTSLAAQCRKIGL